MTANASAIPAVPKFPPGVSGAFFHLLFFSRPLQDGGHLRFSLS